MNDLIFGWKGQIKDPVLLQTIVNAICDKVGLDTLYIACIYKDEENETISVYQSSVNQQWCNLATLQFNHKKCLAGVITVGQQILSTQSEIVAVSKVNYMPTYFDAAIEWLESENKEISGEVCLLNKDEVYLYSEKDNFAVCQIDENTTIWCNHTDIIDKVRKYNLDISCESVSGLKIITNLQQLPNKCKRIYEFLNNFTDVDLKHQSIKTTRNSVIFELSEDDFDRLWKQLKFYKVRDYYIYTVEGQHQARFELNSYADCGEIEVNGLMIIDMPNVSIYRKIHICDETYNCSVTIQKVRRLK